VNSELNADDSGPVDCLEDRLLRTIQLIGP